MVVMFGLVDWRLVCADRVIFGRSGVGVVAVVDRERTNFFSSRIVLGDVGIKHQLFYAPISF